MIGRGATIGLSLLCALLFSAIAVQSASAVPAINTTVFTCVKDGPTSEFQDAHCDEKGGASPKYGHVEIPVAGGKTETTSSNKTTGGATEPVTLTGTVAGFALEVSCTTSHGIGAVQNTQPKPNEHKWDGILVKGLGGCTVNKPAKCFLKGIEMNNLELEGVEGLGPEKNEMGVEYKPAEGKVLSTFTLESKGEEKCVLAGKPLNLEGTMIATGKTKTQTEKYAGSTQVFSAAMTSETLTLAGAKASFSAITTVEMAPVGGKTQSPISLTTTT